MSDVTVKITRPRFQIGIKKKEATVKIGAVGTQTSINNGKVQVGITKKSLQIKTTEKIMVDYGKWKFKRPVTPTPDGVTTLFTVPDNYRAGTLRMYISATRLMSGDFTEVSPNQVEIGWAPQAGENVEADYIKE